MVSHTLAAGTADNHTFKIGECYSGGPCYTGAKKDQTPEYVTRYQIPEWSVMGRGAYYINQQTARTAFSIEELLTVDFKDIPSIDD